MLSKALVLLGLLTSVVIAACATASGNAVNVQALISEGQQAGGARQDANCISSFTQALGAEPSLVVAYLGRASCYLDEGNPAAAVQDYDQAVALSPEDPSIYLGRAAAYEHTGNYTRARADFSRAGTESPSDPAQIIQAAQGLGQLGFYGDALAVLDQGVRRYENYWDLHRYRGEVEGILGNDATALTEFKAAVALSYGTELAFVLDTRANFYQERQQYSLALADLDRAIGLNPNEYSLFAARARVHLEVGTLQTAVDDFTNAITKLHASGGQLATLAGLLEERAKVFIQQGLKLEARDDLDAALKLTPVADTVDRTRLASLRASVTA